MNLLKKHLSRPEIDQVTGRFNKYIGNLGILVCGVIEDKTNLIHRCKDTINNGQEPVIVLCDEDMVNLLYLYKNKFILKGGMLIADIVGIDNRSTMDMDATIKGYPLNEEALSQAIKEICEIKVGDDVKFSFVKVQAIREDD